ncbi:Lysine-specific demethylase 5B [Gonapodya sp. JEL0774]|nr:Lysine-specific demethylase 5B [Gonapodya sp. JEL0774]
MHDLSLVVRGSAKGDGLGDGEDSEVDKSTRMSRTGKAAGNSSRKRKRSGDDEDGYDSDFVVDDDVIEYENGDSLRDQHVEDAVETAIDTKSNSVAVVHDNLSGNDGRNELATHKLQELSLSELLSRFGDNVKLVASEDRRLQACVWKSGAKAVNSHQFPVLEYLARKRTFETHLKLQRELKIDAKTLHHIVKQLSSVGLVYAAHNAAYQAYLHEKARGFTLTEAPESSSSKWEGAYRGDAFYSRISATLQTMVNWTLSVRDLETALGLEFVEPHHRKMWQASLRQLMTLGFVDKIDVPVGPATMNENKGMTREDVLQGGSDGMELENAPPETVTPHTPRSKKKKAKHVTCVRLLKPFVPKHAVKKSLVETLEDPDGDRKLDRLTIAGDGKRLKSNLYRVAEFFGRERRYRYHVASGYFKFLREQNLKAHEASLVSLPLRLFSLKESGVEELPKPQTVDESILVIESLPPQRSAPMNAGSAPVDQGRKLRERKVKPSLPVEDPKEDHSDVACEEEDDRMSVGSQSDGSLGASSTNNIEKELEEANVLLEPVPLSSVHADEVVCKVCRSGDNGGRLLLCDNDACNVGIHTYCLAEPIRRIPAGDWFCSAACSVREETGGTTTPHLEAQGIEVDQSSTKRSRKATREDDDYMDRSDDNNSESASQSESETDGDDSTDDDENTFTNDTFVERPNRALVYTKRLNVKNEITAENKRPTISIFQREKIIMNLLNRHRMIDLRSRNRFNDLYAAMAAEMNIRLTGSTDHRTHNSTINSLVSKGLVCRQKVLIPSPQGKPIEKTILCLGSLAGSSELLHYIRNLKDAEFIGTTSVRKLPVMNMQIGTLNHSAPSKVQLDHQATDVTRNSMEDNAIPSSTLEPANFDLNSAFNAPTAIPQPLPSLISSRAETFPYQSSSKAAKAQMQTSTDANVFHLKVASDYGWINVGTVSKPRCTAVCLTHLYEAKFLRAQKMHEFFLDLVLSGKVQDLDMELHRVAISQPHMRYDGVFHVTDVLREMTFIQYLQLIGHFTKSAIIDWFLHLPGSSHTKLHDVPSEVRMEIFGDFARYRRRMKEICDILESLGVLRPLPNDLSEAVPPQWGAHNKSKSMAPRYQIVCQVSLRSLWTPSTPPVETYQIDCLENLQLYWSSLQRMSLSEDGKGGELIDPSDDELEDKSDAKRRKRRARTLPFGPEHPLGFINLRRSWIMMDYFTMEQRNTLDHYLNEATFSTPLHDASLLNVIISETKLSLDTIIKYYARIDAKWKVKARILARQKNIPKVEVSSLTSPQLDSLVVPVPSDTSLRTIELLRVLSSKSVPSVSSSEIGRADVTQLDEEKDIAHKNANSRRKQKGKSLGRQKLESLIVTANIEHDLPDVLPAGVDETLLTRPRKAMRRRPIWNRDSEEILLHALIILQHGSVKGRFKSYWGLASELFGMSTNDKAIIGQLQRRLKRVKGENPVRAKQLEQRWEAVYRAGVTHGDLTEFPSRDSNWKLHREVEYFLLRSVLPESTPGFNSQDQTEISTILPRDISQLETHFVVTADVNEGRGSGDRIYPSTLLSSSRLALDMLLSLPFTSAVHQDTHASKVNEDDVQSQLLKVLFRVLGIIPSDHYDPEIAFAALQKFPPQLVSNTLEELKNEGTLNRFRPVSERRTAGRIYNVSDKFTAVFLGQLSGLRPGFISRAADYLREVVKSKAERLPFQPLLDDEAVATTLDLVGGRQFLPVPSFERRVTERDGGLLEFDLGHVNSLWNGRTRESNALFGAQREIRKERGKRERDNDKEDEVEGISEKAATTFKRMRTAVSVNGKDERLSSAVISDDKVRSQQAEVNDLKMELWWESMPLRDAALKVEICKVFTVVDAAGEDGVDGTSLEALIPSIPVSILRTHLHMLTIPDDQNFHPVLRVGFACPRIVSYKHAFVWTMEPVEKSRKTDQVILTPEMSRVSTDGARSFLPSTGSEVVRRTVEVSGKSHADRKDRFVLRLWKDLSGNIKENVLKVCLEAVLGVVCACPGVTESQLREKLKIIVNAAEVKELVGELVQRGALAVREVPPSRLVSSIWDVDGDEDGEDAGALQQCSQEYRMQTSIPFTEDPSPLGYTDIRESCTETSSEWLWPTDPDTLCYFVEPGWFAGAV